MSEKIRNKSLIRIQKSKAGTYIQLVIVKYDADGRKQDAFFSIGYWPLKNYLDGTSNSKYLTAERMFSPDSDEYKEYLKKKKAKKKQKTE